MSQTPSFDRNLTEARALKSFALSAITIFCAILACIPLFSVLYMLILRGGKRLSFELFYALPPTAFDTGGGFGNAILGTLVMVGIASLIAVPFGTLAAIFLAEFGENSKIADIARFCAKTMTGIPSILAGVLAYTAVVMVTGTYSAIAGGIALSLLMIPTVMLTAEESIKMVPSIMREAAVGIGCTKTQVMWKVMLPVAMPGMITGVMLAVARASGETAPLLFTALFSDYWIFQSGAGDIMEPTASLAVLIYNFSGMPFDNQIELAWAASLVLVVIVFIINIASRMLFQKKK